MKNLDTTRKQKVNEVVAIVKLLSVFFCSIIIISMFSSNSDGIVINRNFFVMFTNMGLMKMMAICVSILFIGYFLWAHSTRKESDDAVYEVKTMLELIIFLIACSGLVVFSGTFQSQYKFIYLFLIITTTIQFGTSYGMTMAFGASAFLLTMDLFSLSLSEVNRYFETDVVLSGIFILTAWLLGHYVKIEEEYREKMEGLANTDGLTGLYNHRYFQDSFKWQMDIYENTKSPVSLLLVDIDYFKNYNDHYGHLAGDEVLKKIASVLRKCIRSNDIVSRYGGEEFAVLLPDTMEEQAMKVAERIRKMVGETAFMGEENQPGGKLTVSVGVSSFPKMAKSRVELLKSADDALYKAKFMNKDRVETYNTIVEELKTDIEREHIDLISSLKTLISIINARDNYTFSHTERVVTYCLKIARKLELNEWEKKILKYGAYMHDIGKIEIPKYILNKKMPLTEKEWELLKKHPANGVQIINTVESLNNVIPLIMYHHERFDGSGYPEGLKGKNIPLLVRILTVADSFDAMTSKRPYKPAKTLNEAIAEIRKCESTQFDPEIANAFIEMLAEEKSKYKSAN